MLNFGASKPRVKGGPGPGPPGPPPWIRTWVIPVYQLYPLPKLPHRQGQDGPYELYFEKIFFLQVKHFCITE